MTKSAAQASGLTADETLRRLGSVGPNTMPDTAPRPLRDALGKFWAPVPWMLEAAVALEVTMGDYVQAAIIAGLLIFNAGLGLLQVRSRAGHPRGVEIEIGADRIRPAGRAMVDRARRRSGAGRPHQAVAGRSGGRFARLGIA